MILKKLYTEPEIFPPVKFKMGINYIYGYKDTRTPEDAKKSLNTIGKSTFLDLVNFALLSKFNKTNERLYAGKVAGILKDVSVLLDFSIDKDLFTIRRSFEKPNKVEISINEKAYKEYQLENASALLYDYIFRRDYSGFQDEKWFRNLISFFIKIQKPEKEDFKNPLLFISGPKESTLLPYHFFLLDVNNIAIRKAAEIHGDILKNKQTQEEIKKIFSEKLGTKEFEAINSHINTLKIEVAETEKLINESKPAELLEQFHEDFITGCENMEKTRAEIFNDMRLLKSYNDNLKEKYNFSTRKIKAIYDDVNSMLGASVVKSLEEAIEFQKNLVKSREEFVKGEITLIERRIAENTNLLKKHMEEYNAVKNRIDEAEGKNKIETTAYSVLFAKQSKLAELVEKAEVMNALKERKNNLEKELSVLQSKLNNFRKENEAKEIEITEEIIAIYESLYLPNKKKHFFEFKSTPGRSSKIKIEILDNPEFKSKGKERVKTLIYDLMILFLSIKNNIKGPRFLIHDGIFDGVDKSQFIETVKLIERKIKEGMEFQYILTLNEEGTLSQNFGESDYVNPDKLRDEAILVLSPDRKLLGEF